MSSSTSTESASAGQAVEQNADEASSDQTPAGIDLSGPSFGASGWVLAIGSTLFTSHARAWTPRSSAAAAKAQPRPAPARRGFAPQKPSPPLPPQAPAALGAAPGGSSGGSLWVFVGLLLPFFLTAPWWARRQRPSVVRRLMGVVSRLERPG
jgi:hypothetical protein